VVRCGAVSAPGSPPLVTLLPLALVVYAALAVALEGWWLSALGAAFAAGLLWRRSTRARFVAYVFGSALVMRAVVAGAWPPALVGLTLVAVLQTADAVRIWPRVPRRRRRERAEPGDTMARP
jgi:hypothetical protein